MNKFKLSLTPLFPYIPYILLLLILVTFNYFFLDYIFFYQEKSFLFIQTNDFLIEHLNRPGSFLIYLGKFFSAFYYYPLIGSLLISLLILSLVLLIYRILSLISGNETPVIPFLTGCVLFYLHTQYQYLLFNTIGLLFQVLFFYLIIRYIRKMWEWLIVLLIPFWYFLTGSFAFILLVNITLYMIYRPGKKQWLKVSIMWCIIFLSLFIAKQFLFFQPLKDLLIFPFSLTAIGYQTLPFLILIVILSSLPLILKIKIRFLNTSRTSVIFKYSILPFAFIAITTLLCALRIDKNDRHYFHIEKLFYQNKMDELINYNMKNPANNRLTSYLTNIALCETGRLNDLLFHFPQSLENNTLFLQWERIKEILKRGGYFYYTVGLTNEAHRWFYEYMVMEGYTPQGLIMLIKTELVNGNDAMASKYIQLLKSTFFYKNQAFEFEKLLNNDTAVNSHPELGEKRKNRLHQDFFVDTKNPLLNLANILDVDSFNKQAFEYKLAYLLLKKDFISAVNEIPNLESFGYTKIPGHLQEAFTVYRSLPDMELPDLGNLKINKETELRYQQFYQTFQQSGKDRKAAENVLKEKFGNTFWFYVIYY